MALAQIAPTPPEGVEGELVYAGGGGLSDYEGKNVHGKVVMVLRKRASAAVEELCRWCG